MNKEERQELYRQMESHVQRLENNRELPDVQEENIFVEIKGERA